MGVEERARAVDGVRCRAEPNAERVAGLVAGFGCLEEYIERPALRLWRRSGRVKRLQIDPGVLFEQVDARAWALDLRSDRCRGSEAFDIRLAEIGHRLVYRAVLLDQFLHDVVDRFEALGVAMRLP